MALLSMKGISVDFGGPPVIENLDLQIERGERICLLGRNGAGKSTLMKVISDDISPRQGDIIRQAGLRVALLPQEIPLGIQGSTLDVVLSGMKEPNDFHPGFHHDHESQWQSHQQINHVISLMELDPKAPYEDLSAGLKRRVLLARSLTRDPDILLLDEPTNHLDMGAISWLESFLLRFAGTLFFVTHDRMLLRKLATRIIELDRGELVDWSCDYDTFLQRKQAILDTEEEHWAQFDKKLAREEIWIRKGVKARRTRNEGRVRALERMREQRRARRERTGNVRLQIQDAERSGKLVVETDGVSYSYGDQLVIRNLSISIMRGDKVGIIGPNGAGKTTLLKILVGELPPNDGRMRLGTRLEVAYFDQLRSQLDESKSVQDNVADGNDTVILDGKPRHVIGYLQDFLFSAERARSPVSVLSGGERNRLLLARLFSKPSNVLILDEPTNDLDVETLELLEELLVEYPGTIFLVSHDRAFLNNVVTSTLVFEGDGRIEEYVGGYDDWLRQRKPHPSNDPGPKRSGAKAEGKRLKPERPRKLTFNERQELEKLPELIESLEDEQKAIYETMALPEFYKKDSSEIVKSRLKLAELEKKLADAYRRWEILEAIGV